MNEVSYGAPRPEAVRDLNGVLSNGVLSTQARGADPAATEALARDFLARVQRDIDEQVDLRVQQMAGAKGGSKGITSEDLGLALGSLGIGIPLSAIAGAFGHLPGLILAWAGLVIINVAWARRR